MPSRSSLARRTLLAALAALPARADPIRFEAQLDTFAAEDREQRSADGSLLFVGSSTIRLWPALAARFAPRPVVRRGFGGATLGEVIDHRALLFAPHRPSGVVLYAGENDIAAGLVPAVVVARFRRLRALLADTPTGRAPLVFIALKPSPRRRHLWPAMAATNAAIADLPPPAAPTAIVDPAAFVLDPTGTPRRGLFLDDGLHFNARGYDRLGDAVAGALERARVRL